MKKILSIMLCTGLIVSTSAICKAEVIDNENVVKDGIAAEILSDGTLSIYAVNNSDDSTKISIPSEIDGYKVSTIPLSLFSSYKKVEIPETVKKIDYESNIISDNSDKVCEYIVSSKNKYYYSKAGVLFKKKSNTLLAYPDSKKDKSYTVPKNVKEIGAYAFSFNSKLQSVKISKNVTKIGACAFKSCAKLSSVTIDGKVTKIGNKNNRAVFTNCKKLKKLTVKKGSKFSLAGVSIKSSEYISSFGESEFECKYKTSNKKVVPLSFRGVLKNSSAKLALTAKNKGTAKITISESFVNDTFNENFGKVYKGELQ